MTAGFRLTITLFAFAPLCWFVGYHLTEIGFLFYEDAPVEKIWRYLVDFCKEFLGFPLLMGICAWNFSHWSTMLRIRGRYDGLIFEIFECSMQYNIQLIENWNTPDNGMTYPFSTTKGTKAQQRVVSRY